MRRFSFTSRWGMRPGRSRRLTQGLGVSWGSLGFVVSGVTLRWEGTLTSHRCLLPGQGQATGDSSLCLMEFSFWHLSPGQWVPGPPGGTPGPGRGVLFCRNSNRFSALRY